MLRRFLPCFFLCCGFILLGGHGFDESTAQETKKYTGRLPNGWRKLGLSKDQVQQIYKVQTEYGEKIEALELQIEKLEEEEKGEMLKVLTDPQREYLKKMLLEKAGIKLPSPKKEVKPQE